MARRRDGIQKAPRASPIVAELGPRLRSGEIVLLDAPLPCPLAGSGRLLAVLEERCRDDPGLEVRRCQCLGICERAPAVALNGNPEGPATAEAVIASIAEGRGPRSAA